MSWRVVRELLWVLSRIASLAGTGPE